MQLTLLTPFAQPSAAAGAVSRRGHAAPSREAVAMSQLDRIAAQNLRPPAHGLGASGVLLALLGGLVVLGAASMWRGVPVDGPRPAIVVADSQPIPAPAPSVSPAPVVTAAAVPSAPAELNTTLPAQVATAETAAETAAVTVAAPAVDPAADDAARKARARQLADARRQAAQVAQERAAAEESQRLQLAQQREAERAQQHAAEQARQRAAAEQARAQTIQVALNTRRSVGDACSAAGGPISRYFCSARECSKAEHQGDPVCVNLRDDELARQRASNER